jgi:hypothetical protein
MGSMIFISGIDVLSGAEVFSGDRDLAMSCARLMVAAMAFRLLHMHTPAV